MTLIVETGLGTADSEAFASAAQATDYHTKRGNAAWLALTTDQQENALRAATDYLEQVYRLRWSGSRASDTQALSWPRYQVPRIDRGTTALFAFGYGSGYSFYPSASVPKEVVYACCVLALKASANELAPDLDRPTVTEVVGPIRVDYAPGTREFVRFRAVDLMLAPLLKTSGMGLKVTRA